jgi:hypothetical protein
MVDTEVDDPLVRTIVGFSGEDFPVKYIVEAFAQVECPSRI